MNLRDRLYKPGLLGLALILLCGVSQMQQRLNRDRDAFGLTKLTPLQNAPPVLAFTSVALGGFRGLIANALWLRLSDLQDEDKFFEMVQLSDWITKLEPHYLKVWSHQAWNLAYNVSVKFKEPEDRWRWVQRGIRLLRDEGIPLNKDDAHLYVELSRLFQMKVGQNLDDAHTHYKQSWANEMQTLFGGNANIPELVHPTTPEAIARVKTLSEKYKMDPKTMEEVDKLYGPFEWRLPDAHAVYWAEVGRRKSTPKDQEQLRRAIFQCMQQAFRQGKLDEIGSGTNLTYIVGPNLALAHTANAAYEKMEAEDPERRDNFRIGHRNFLEQSIYFLFSNGERSEARFWFDYLKKNFPEQIPANLTLDEYAFTKVTEQLKETDNPKTTAIIMGYLRIAISFLANDEQDEAVKYEQQAQRIWTYFQSRIPKDQATQTRVGLLPMEVLKQNALARFLEQFPQAEGVLRAHLKMPAPAQSSTTPPPAN